MFGDSIGWWAERRSLQNEICHAIGNAPWRLADGAAIGSTPAITLMDSYVASDNDERQQFGFSVC